MTSDAISTDWAFPASILAASEDTATSWMTRRTNDSGSNVVVFAVYNDTPKEKMPDIWVLVIKKNSVSRS